MQAQLGLVLEKEGQRHEAQARGLQALSVRNLAAEAPQDATLVIFHTAVLPYVPHEQRAAFEATVRALNATWIANEGPRVLGVDPATVPPGLFVIARDGVPAAWADPHGASLRWL